MYSMVVMLAMTGGTEVPDLGRRGRRGCNGCQGYVGCHGSYGSYGCSGWHGGGSGCCGWSDGWHGSGCNGADFHKKTDADEEMTEEESRGVNRPAPARLRVRVPAGTTLSIQGKPVEVTGETLSFVTRPLARGKTYTYRLEAEITRDGETLTRTREIQVRAGQVAQVSITFPRASVAGR